MNFRLVDEAIVFGTDTGVKLAHSSLHPVALEVDSLEDNSRTGWVVVAKGHAEDITDGIDPWSTRLRQTFIDSWVDLPLRHRVGILRPTLTGRRLVTR